MDIPEKILRLIQKSFGDVRDERNMRIILDIYQIHNYHSLYKWFLERWNLTEQDKAMIRDELFPYVFADVEGK